MKNQALISDLESNKNVKKIPAYLGYAAAVMMMAVPLIAKNICESTLPLHGLWKEYLGGMQKIPMHFPGVYFLVFMFLIFKLLYEMGSDAEYISDAYEDRNISEQAVMDASNIFLRKLILITKAPYFLRKSYLPDTDESSAYCYEKYFEGMEIRSYDGNQTDYFFLHHRRWPVRLRILLIGRYTVRRQAIRLLTAQQFDFCESDGRVMKFEKDQMTVRLAYDNFGWSLRGIEICTRDTCSELAAKTQSDREESFEAMLNGAGDTSC